MGDRWPAKVTRGRETRPPGRARGSQWPRRLGWMALLWAGGVAALGAVALLLRMLMHAAGMR